MSRLETKLAEYWNAKTALNQAYDTVKELKEIVDVRKAELEAEMRAGGLKTARTDDYTAVLNNKIKIEVMHEPSVIDWLKHKAGVEPDLYIGLKRQAFDGLARAVMNKDGEKIPGTEIMTIEYLSVKNNKKGEVKNG